MHMSERARPSLPIIEWWLYVVERRNARDEQQKRQWQLKKVIGAMNIRQKLKTESSRCVCVCKSKKKRDKIRIDGTEYVKIKRKDIKWYEPATEAENPNKGRA